MQTYTKASRERDKYVCIYGRDLDKPATQIPYKEIDAGGRNKLEHRPGLLYKEQEEREREKEREKRTACGGCTCRHA